MNIVLAELSWIAAEQTQAIDRSHRIGQTEPVTAWRVIAAQTIDARIAELIDGKAGLAAQALDGPGHRPGSRGVPDDRRRPAGDRRPGRHPGLGAGDPRGAGHTGGLGEIARRFPVERLYAGGGVLGVDTRADTVEHLSDLLRSHDVAPEAWYGVWLFCDWLDLPTTDTDVGAVAEVELQASRRDPYRQLSRVFHLVGRDRS